MPQHYSSSERATDPHALPDIEVFYVANDRHTDDDGVPLEPGWYWWSCFPGCLPDSEPTGPFDTEMRALLDARGGNI